nr:hypothetical protein BaRGS_025760 [Batillaria attramentaria]
MAVLKLTSMYKDAKGIFDVKKNTCLRRIFNIRWPEKIRNEELGSERSRNQWPSRSCGGSGAGLDTPSGSQHPAPHAKP